MLELPPSFLAVEIDNGSALRTWRICLNAFLVTDGWRDRLVVLGNNGPENTASQRRTSSARIRMKTYIPTLNPTSVHVLQETSRWKKCKIQRYLVGSFVYT